MIIWPCNRKNKNKSKFKVSCKFKISRHFNKWPFMSKLSAILPQTKHIPLLHLRHAALLLKKTTRLLVLEWLFQHHQKFSSMKLAFQKEAICIWIKWKCDWPGMLKFVCPPKTGNNLKEGGVRGGGLVYCWITCTKVMVEKNLQSSHLLWWEHKHSRLSGLPTFGYF